MQHTPFGYDIIGGKAVVNTEKAEMLKKTIDSYLSGKSLASAAAEAGLQMDHPRVERLIMNKKYLGDGFYPAIITEETARAIEAEHLKREKALGRKNMPKKEKTAVKVRHRFTLATVEKKYEDIIKQAEYAYSLIESEED